MDDEQLKAILEVNELGHIRRRESTVLEFKANFNFGQVDKYAKTMAAFANNRGGVLLFGVTNRPRLPKGMSNDKFYDIDPERIANEINNIFQPEIHWSMKDLSIDGKNFGFLIIEEAKNKPVVARINKGDSIKEGAIFYRYNARNELIKFGEMRSIIDSIKDRERKLWLSHLKQIAHIGPEHTGIFNPKDGLVKGPSGAFIVDRTILPFLQFIREGEFVEKDGAPTVKLIGQARVIGGDEEDWQGVIGIQEKAINQNDIIVNFLNKIQVRSPVEYLKQICLEGVKYLPFYYYLRLANIKLDELEDFLTEIQGYNAILERVSTDPIKLPIKLRNTGTEAYSRKREMRRLLRKGKLKIPDEKKDLRYLLSVLRSIDDTETIRNILIEIYRLPLRKIEIIGDFRITVCYLDFIENIS
jgi:hypothetical protein